MELLWLPRITRSRPRPEPHLPGRQARVVSRVDREIVEREMATAGIDKTKELNRLASICQLTGRGP